MVYYNQTVHYALLPQPLLALNLAPEGENPSLGRQSQSQHCFETVSGNSEVDGEVVGEKFSVDGVYSNLLDEVGFSGAPTALQKDATHPLLVDEGLDDFVHLLLDPQTVVLPQTLQHSPPLSKLKVALRRLLQTRRLFLLLGKYVQLRPLLGLFLADRSLDFVEELPDRFVVSEEAHVKAFGELFADFVVGFALIADGDDVFFCGDSFCEFEGEAGVEDGYFGERACVEEFHEGAAFEFDELPYFFFVFDVELFLFVAVAAEVEDGGAFDEGVLDVGLGGRHHFYSEVSPELFLLDDVDELVVLDLVADFALGGHYLQLGARLHVHLHQRVCEKVSNVDGSTVAAPPYFLLPAPLNRLGYAVF